VLLPRKPQDNIGEGLLRLRAAALKAFMPAPLWRIQNERRGAVSSQQLKQEVSTAQI